MHPLFGLTLSAKIVSTLAPLRNRPICFRPLSQNLPFSSHLAPQLLCTIATLSASQFCHDLGYIKATSENPESLNPFNVITKISRVWSCDYLKNASSEYITAKLTEVKLGFELLFH